MTNKEKEKLFTLTIKTLSKVQKWKFKGYFIFKRIDNLFFTSNFYINPKTNTIHGYLSYKPYSIDTTFWELIAVPENSKMPLSFRAEAAFCVSGFHSYNYEITIKNIENPEKELQSLLQLIDEEVIKTTKQNSSTEDFLNTLAQENNNPVGIVSCLMELGRYEEVLDQIAIFKKNDVPSGYNFEGRDFFDLATTICNQKLNSKTSIVVKIGNRIRKTFKN